MVDKKNPWWKTCLGVLAMLLWVFASVIASQLVVGLVMSLLVGDEALGTPVVTTVYSALSYILALILVIFVPSRVLKKTKKTGKKPQTAAREELGLKGWPTWTDIGLAPVGFIVQLVLSMLLVGLFSLFPWFDMEQAQDVGYDVLNGGVDRVVAFISLVVIAPIAEEIIFRGWLYGKLRRKL